MGSALGSKASGLRSSPGQGHCVVFLGKTLYSHSTSLHAHVYKKVPVNSMLGGNIGVEILLVASCYRNCYKPWSDGPQLAHMQTLPFMSYHTCYSTPSYL